jgi:hypothetical protein
MPTLKPQLKITMRPEMYALFKRLGELEGRPASKVLLEMLEQIEPMLQGAVAALEEAVKHRDRPGTAMLLAISRMDSAVKTLADKSAQQLDFLRTEGAAPRQLADAQRSPAVRPRKRATKAVKGRKRRGAT